MKYSIEQIIRKKTPIFSLSAPLALAKRMSGIRTHQRYRNEYMRDRDRVLYSKAFRRLSGKTQVYLSGVDDHKRTRLTHTLEVSQISRSISSALLLDPDLTEAIALGHDLGHTPYGHVGERTLHEIMTPHEKHELGELCPIRLDSDTQRNSDIISKYFKYLGFKHNLHSLKCAMQLEKNYGTYGLDLTNFTLFGIQFHSKPVYDEGKIINPEELHYYDHFINQGCSIENGQLAWSFEAFVVAEADEIAQRHHDVEDAIRGNIIAKDEISKIIIEIFKNYLKPKDKKDINNALGQDDESFIATISRVLVNMFVKQLIRASIINMNLLIFNERLTKKSFPMFIANHLPQDDVIKNVIAYTEDIAEDDFKKSVEGFQKTIAERVLSSYDIQKSDAKGKYVIRKIFQAYYRTPQQLPNHCVYEYLQHCYPEKYSEEIIQKDIKKNGNGKIRNEFTKLVSDSSEFDDQNKLLLMRVICDHIAGMTDSYASRTYEEFYG